MENMIEFSLFFGILKSKLAIGSPFDTNLNPGSKVVGRKLL